MKGDTMRRFTVAQVSDYFDVANGTVRSWLSNGKIRGVKQDQLNPGKPRYTTFISEQEIKRFIDDNPKYNYVIEKIWPVDETAEERKTEINECFDRLKFMKEDCNKLVRDMNILIEHLNKLLELEKK